ncbi:hypothetical protein ABG067_003031 [Albugo candida]
MLRDPRVADFFTRLIQRVSPKSYTQAETGVIVTEKFFENSGGDQVRFGQVVWSSRVGYRWPCGPVALITPFNFPFEIPLLQRALNMGNKVLIKLIRNSSAVIEKLALDMVGRIKLEDAGFDWKYSDDQLDLVLQLLEKMHAHLNAAVVSNDDLFRQKVLARSVNGTTNAGIRARTTGSPQNHWFGPAGDPRNQDA